MAQASGIPAIVTAGDRAASRAVYGESKVYLEVVGRPLVAHVVATLQRVPEVSDVWVVGDRARLEGVFADERVRAELTKPLHIVEQHGNLYENCWETFKCSLPGAGPDGREPAPGDEDWQVLYLSGDLPFATPQEISEFVKSGQTDGCDYALGLVEDEVLRGFLPAAPGEPGITVAYFNLREGRFRQNNLHLAKPLRMGARHYIEEMYENRHQRELKDILGLLYRLLVHENVSLGILYYFVLMHVSGMADRRGLTRIADTIRSWIPIERVQRGVCSLLQTEFRFVVTHVGGSAIDVDTEPEYDAVQARFDEWMKAQTSRAEALHGPALVARAGSSDDGPGPGHGAAG